MMTGEGKKIQMCRRGPRKEGELSTRCNCWEKQTGSVFPSLGLSGLLLESHDTKAGGGI